MTHENIVSGIAALQTYTEHIGIEVRVLLKSLACWMVVT